MNAGAIACVLTKPPRPGQAKTRLARSLGPLCAARIARALLEDVWRSITGVPWLRSVLVSTEPEARELCLDPPAEIWPQSDGHLGQRIEAAARRALDAVELVIVLGSDSPGVPRPVLEQARDLLAGDHSDAVLGPAADGGFYLFGATRFPPGVFDGVPWSSPSTCAEALRALRSAGLRTALVEPWFDIDAAEDLASLKRCIASGTIDAPSTERVIATLSI